MNNSTSSSQEVAPRALRRAVADVGRGVGIVVMYFLAHTAVWFVLLAVAPSLINLFVPGFSRGVDYRGAYYLAGILGWATSLIWLSRISQDAGRPARRG